MPTIFFVLISLEETLALEVAEKTGRARVVESSYLNQLERVDCLRRMRKERTVYSRMRL